MINVTNPLIDMTTYKIMVKIWVIRLRRIKYQRTWTTSYLGPVVQLVVKLTIWLYLTMG